MFDQVFHYKHYTKELTTGSLSPYLDEIAQVLFDRGHSRRKVRNKFITLGQLSRWMKRHKMRSNQLNDAAIQKFIRVEARRVVWPLSDLGAIATLKLLMRMLREKGIIPSPQKAKPSPSELLLDEFADHLSTERGMSAGAIYCYKRYAGFFIDDRFGDRKMEWGAVDSDDVYQFMLRRSRQFTQGTNKLIVTCLRSFFRFLRFSGDVDFDLSRAVPSVPHWRAANLPYYLKPDELRKLLHSIDRSTSIGKRDYAILLLLARLGLRACEVAGLSIEDLDWSNAEIITHGKGTRRKRLPISGEVGDALASYFRVRRRNTKTRKVFLRNFPPYEGITKGLVGMIVRTDLERAGLKPYKRGSHLLRHTAATEMLRKGASLTEIGMILGHRSVESTAIYAKVDFETLFTLVRPWPLSLPLVGGGR